MRRYDVVVVGAGLAGLAAVLRLRTAGLSIAVIDNVERLDGARMNWGHDLQPNGLSALAELGLLDEVKRLGAVHDHYYLESLGGGRLSSWDYAILAHPHPYAVCIRTHLLRQLLRDRVAELDYVEPYIPATFHSLKPLPSGGHLVTVESNGDRMQLEGTLVIGADGPRSRARGAAGIEATFRRGNHHWLDVILDDTADEIRDGYVYFGRGEYLGLVPTRSGELVAFHLTSAKDLPTYQAQFGDIEALRRTYVDFAPVLARARLDSWQRCSHTPGHSMRAERWVRDGFALVGDAAVTVNPVTSQGACLALEGGIALADVVSDGFRRADLSAAALSSYEQACRPVAESMQLMGQMFARNFAQGNPLFSALQLRVLREIDKRPAMKHRVLAYFAGIDSRRIGWRDGLAAAGLWPSARRELAIGTRQAPDR